MKELKSTAPGNLIDIRSELLIKSALMAACIEMNKTLV